MGKHWDVFDASGSAYVTFWRDGREMITLVTASECAKLEADGWIAVQGVACMN